MTIIQNILTEIFRAGVIPGLLVFLLIGVGFYDLYLVLTKRKTISQKVHAWFPRWGDAAVLVGLLVLIWIIFSPAYFVTVMAGVLMGHFFWYGGD